ncbi:MAG: transglutaminase-like domain-containing protein [Gammaproteobacteria bacterium]|nr:transglutaminase-like domain-containing protein [Gammaproteobacteria bacterium]
MNNQEASPDDQVRSGETRPLSVVIFLLVFVALAVSTARYLMQTPGSAPSGDSAWSVTLEAQIDAPEAGATIQIAPPWDTRYARFYGQSLIHAGMRQQRVKAKHRDIVLVSTRAGRLSVNAKFDLHISHIPRPAPQRKPSTEYDRSAWLSHAHGIPVEALAIRSIIDKLTHDNPETPVLVDRIYDHVSEQVRITSTGEDDGGTALAKGTGSALGMTRALITLMRAAHLPARVVTGLDLLSANDRQPKYWAEVYYQDRWQSYDVVSGHRGVLPSTLVPLRKGGESVIGITGAQLTSVRWHIQRDTAPRGLLVSDTRSYLDFMDLTRLAPATREIIGLLLLLPLGALSTEVLRQFIGIRTYGTFMPTLLALAAVFVDWLTAVTVFFLVTTLGVAGRALLPGLQLSRVSRLSVVFTLVAVFMALAVSLLVFLNPKIDSTVVLLPIVILTTLVDRIYTVADESGLRTAILRLAWTIAAALVSMVVLLQAHWGEWILIYPESHAITLAVIIIIGGYRGRRLADLSWLSWIREPKVKSSGKSRKGKSSGKSSSSVDQPPGQSSEVI